jgi:hypothetical protein
MHEDLGFRRSLPKDLLAYLFDSIGFLLRI